jgi:hypothetical protein
MNQKRVAFVRDANKHVNDALHAISKIQNLANRSRYNYTVSEVDQIVAALHTEVSLTGSVFRHQKNGGTTGFQLSRIDSGSHSNSDKPENWKNAFASLTRRRAIANQKLRDIQSKPFATGKSADYLLRGIAKTLQLSHKPADVDLLEWMLGNPKNVVILDAKKAAETFFSTLEKAPQSMIKGRLKTIQSFAPEVSDIQVIRAPKKLRLPRTVDSRYAVVLYRGSRPAWPVK